MTKKRSCWHNGERNIKDCKPTCLKDHSNRVTMAMPQRKVDCILTVLHPQTVFSTSRHF